MIFYMRVFEKFLQRFFLAKKSKESCSGKFSNLKLENFNEQLSLHILNTFSKMYLVIFYDVQTQKF